MIEPTDYGDWVSRATNAVAGISDPELKRIAFQEVLNDMRASQPQTETLSRLVQVLSVVIAAVISILSFNETRQAEIHKQQTEARQPFLVLRQKTYMDAIQAAAVLANWKVHTTDEVDKARTRFHDLYVAELSLVEAGNVENEMVALARALKEKELYPENLDKPRQAALDLAHALRDSLVRTWGIEPTLVANPQNKPSNARGRNRLSARGPI